MIRNSSGVFGRFRIVRRCTGLINSSNSLSQVWAWAWAWDRELSTSDTYRRLAWGRDRGLVWVCVCVCVPDSGVGASERKDKDEWDTLGPRRRLVDFSPEVLFTPGCGGETRAESHMTLRSSRSGRNQPQGTLIRPVTLSPPPPPLNQCSTPTEQDKNTDGTETFRRRREKDPHGTRRVWAQVQNPETVKSVRKEGVKRMKPKHPRWLPWWISAGVKVPWTDRPSEQDPQDFRVQHPRLS